MSPDDALGLAAFAALGLALGTANFLLLRRTTRLLVTGEALRGGLLQLLRLLAVAAVFVLTVRWGALPLVLTFAGFLAGRSIVVRRVGAAP